MKTIFLAALALAGATCQSAFFDTISGDCQYHDCLNGLTAPDRFKKYVKPGATDYCPGTSPTGTSTMATATSTEAATSATQAGPASTESTGAAAVWGASRGGVVPAVAAAWMAVGLLG
ncbi:hypothetical protein F5144DRAFT_482748 [Chaetomium tenue]|uniref:Uncharacterized protein n=1 Tax=Chaetomium tenue TaxID=1854479 RepID=A0ACB7PHU2_9PEZI|nr:hypothetical protein F5144DRAFT_482748 [Chaetomium globosum]